MNVTERFLSYVAFHTTSDDFSETFPSTERQKLLGEHLAKELQELGMQNAHMDKWGYVYADLPASPGCEALPALGLIAHMDTSPDASGENIHPRIVRYDGGKLELGSGVFLDDAVFPDLTRCIGQDLIVTDGTTLLGADDKAGVAEIVTLCAYLLKHPQIPHRPISVAFTPDEEVGRGTDHFDFNAFHANVAYTVDGGALGEIEYENFNAASAVVTIHGVNIHPGSAKNKMKNAALLAAEFVGALPAAETPAHTEGYEGFYHVTDISANETQATVRLIVRDHDMEKFTARKNFLSRLTAYLNDVYGAGTFDLALRDSYYNMKEKILPHMELIENAKAAMLAAGVAPEVIPIRGGTDGARLSFEGLPCPNLCTGGINFHSVHECIPVASLEAMVQVLLHLVIAA